MTRLTTSNFLFRLEGSSVRVRGPQDDASQRPGPNYLYWEGNSTGTGGPRVDLLGGPQVSYRVVRPPSETED